ncbi:type IV pilus twitching motility protein PilT [Sulfurospirillum deleyianum]|uniref:Twitching motility protein n=1 Tax=Sulfurospirillum deleyianum (strain ATCC 51133 / DSM 6946 / 5175) TaxID=525898 RepID=D1B0C9_SULD5|nr:PilT/PilU family type 4a pilus ATPase [Sulfurospirillum deleyianum]ACZ11248.1 twitching motility protein [Sulfurospirillum deleyianum DSM 6946]
MAESVNVSELTFEMTKKLKFYLSKLVEHGGSDLHVKTGTSIRGRINGEILPFSKEVLAYQEGLTLAKELLRGRFPEFVEKKNIDFTFKLNDEYRFRVNMFFQVDGVSAVFRTIPMVLPTVESLHLPEVLNSLCDLSRGLVLVTGPTGSGKTTTLASMINRINKNQKKHIITIEDPVEFIYKDESCVVNQRAIGQDALSFADALRAALREDPDVILVGEMRDLETIETAMHAAETGHLVLSTLHTVDAKETIGRIIGMFPGSEQNRIKMSLASVLQGVIAQRLVKTVERGRTAAVEVLVKNARIEALILEGREMEIPDALKEGKEVYKTQTFDQALLELYAEGRIERSEAIKASTSRNDITMALDFYDAEKTQKDKRKNEAPVNLSELKTYDKDIIGLKQ